MDSTYAATTSGNTNSERPGSALVHRYLDLYRAARVMTGLGMTVKVVGVILGAVIFMFWFIVGAAASSSSQSSAPFGPSPASQSAAGVVFFFLPHDRRGGWSSCRRLVLSPGRPHFCAGTTVDVPRGRCCPHVSIPQQRGAGGRDVSAICRTNPPRRSRNCAVGSTEHYDRSGSR